MHQGCSSKLLMPDTAAVSVKSIFDSTAKGLARTSSGGAAPTTLE